MIRQDTALSHSEEYGSLINRKCSASYTILSLDTGAIKSASEIRSESNGTTPSFNSGCLNSSTCPTIKQAVSISNPHSSDKGERVDKVKLCTICGDLSTGIHYSVHSCDGCHSFFRRTVVYGRRFKCHNNGQCLIDKKRRCFCRACRFQKCLDSGMDTKIIKIRRSPPDDDTLPTMSFIDQKLQLQNLVLNEVKLFGLRRTCAYRGGALLDILTMPSPLENDDHLMASCKTPVFTDEQSRTAFWLNYELSISIEYGKTHAVFRNLSFCDKCVLLESTHLSLFIFTAAYEAFFNEKKTLLYANGDELVFGKDAGSPDVLIDSIGRCSLDPATFAFTKALILLSPDVFGLTSQGLNAVEQESERYVRLLSSYTMQRFGDRSASILGESLLLPATALALGRRMRQNPPAYVPLLFLTTPVLSKILKNNTMS